MRFTTALGFTKLSVSFWAVVTLLILVGNTGCQRTFPATAPIESRSGTTEFLLGPEDVLEVVVWRNQDLSRVMVVRPDGMISMPIIGDVQAAGLTPDQLADRITKRLKDFKENPSVSVSVKEVNSYTVFLLGEVARPGKYQLKSYTTILQAISLAGGFTPFAAKNKLQVVRHITNGDGAWHEVRLSMPYDDLISGRADPEYFMVKAGDTIVIP
jgi:polysaccharide export outer membrane protein